ncbi:MAG: diguanylate cyclase [Candidatus Omnitrophica bacterium]|nr:diguanylate cyclase [Candidatus Omnitrophota bacterium]
MKERILVVEDTLADVMFLKKTFEGLNYEITYAENGMNALSILDNDPPDLVILDILLPDIDGFEVCKRIRNDDRFINTPILFYSAIRTSDDKILGLEMGASDFLSKSADDRELLVRVKNLLKIKKKIDSALSISFYDSITKVYSLQYFHHRMYDECVRSRRYKRDLSCMLIDIDNFKVINNTFGIQTGNRVLKKIAELVSQNTRHVDEVCRYKEDAFGLVLPETDLRNAYSAAERIRQYLAMTEDLRTECSLNITVSCGVSYYNEKVTDFNNLIENAHTALLQAKQAGKNQTKFYQ